MASSVSKLIPSDPEKVMVIRKVTPEITTFSTPFSRFGKFKIGGRGTLVRLATGSLAIFSPVALTDTVRKETESQGTVKYIIAPDQEHHIFLESWHKAYPEATIVAPETLPDLRSRQNYFQLPTTRLHLFQKSSSPTGYTVSAEFDAEFQSEYVFAHGNKELVFNHKPTRTLIEADLLFNLPATEQFSQSGEDPTAGFFTKLFNGAMHVRGDATWQKRALWLQSKEDRTAFNTSMRRIQGWEFERIIPCHGDVIETGGKGIFEKITEWHLNASAATGEGK